MSNKDVRVTEAKPRANGDFRLLVLSLLAVARKATEGEATQRGVAGEGRHD